MYKGASDLAQSRNGRQVTVDAMVAGGRKTEALSDAEKLRTLQHALTKIDAQINLTRKGSPERKRLGAHKRQIADECTALRHKLKPRKRGRHLLVHFVDVAREQLPPDVFSALFKDAHARYALEGGVGGAAPPLPDSGDIAA